MRSAGESRVEALRTFGAFLLFTLVLASASGACRRSESDSGAVATPVEEVERLRALGYVGSVPAERDNAASGVVVNDRERSAPGYSLFTNSHLCSAVLIDEGGAVKNYWTMDRCDRWSNAQLLDGGELVVAGSESGRGSDLERRFLLKLSWSGEEIWRRSYPAYHDVEPTPSGTLLALSLHPRLIPAIDASIPVRDNRIVLLSPDGIELESYSLYDLFRASPEVVKLEPVKRQHNHPIDLFHANSVEWLDAPIGGKSPTAVTQTPHVLVSVRHQDTAVLINWKTKRIVWAWGQGEVSNPHDALTTVNGNVLLFDNGLSRGRSRVLEIDPRSRAVAWQYQAPIQKEFYTVSRGSNQRLANGNTLIAESDRGHAFEVTPAGKIVWEFWNPIRDGRGQRASIVRVRRFDRPKIDAIVRAHGEGHRDLPAVRPAATSPTP